MSREFECDHCKRFHDGPRYTFSATPPEPEDAEQGDVWVSSPRFVRDGETDNLCVPCAVERTGGW